MAADTLRPPEPGCPAEQHEPLLHVKAVETGVIDVSISGNHPGSGLIADAPHGAGMCGKDRRRPSASRALIRRQASLLASHSQKTTFGELPSAIRIANRQPKISLSRGYRARLPRSSLEDQQRSFSHLDGC